MAVVMSDVQEMDIISFAVLYSVGCFESAQCGRHEFYRVFMPQGFMNEKYLLIVAVTVV